MSDDSKQSEKIASELLRDPGAKINELKVSTRREILDALVSLMEMTRQKSRLVKSSPRVQQRWVTIFGYLAQVSTRVVRDLEYESLRSELDELKKQVLTKDVIRLRRTTFSPRHGGGDETLLQRQPRRDSH
jgi:hypothetical protein